MGALLVGCASAFLSSFLSVAYLTRRQSKREKAFAAALKRFIDADRQHAREVSARSLAVAASETSNSVLGAHLGGEFAGAQIRTGALVLTPAEVALLLPLPVALAHLSDVLRERIVCELASPDCTEERALRLRLTLVHVDALCVVSAA